MNAVNIAVGIATGIIYALLGYASQDKPFDKKKFLRTVALTTLAALGLDLSSLTMDVYTAAVGPTAITVFVQKIIDSIRS